MLINEIYILPHGWIDAGVLFAKFFGGNLPLPIHMVLLSGQ